MPDEVWDLIMKRFRTQRKRRYADVAIGVIIGIGIVIIYDVSIAHVFG